MLPSKFFLADLLLEDKALSAREVNKKPRDWFPFFCFLYACSIFIYYPTYYIESYTTVLTAYKGSAFIAPGWSVSDEWRHPYKFKPKDIFDSPTHALNDVRNKLVASWRELNLLLHWLGSKTMPYRGNSQFYRLWCCGHNPIHYHPWLCSLRQQWIRLSTALWTIV